MPETVLTMLLVRKLPILGHTDIVGSATFSPDGKRIATASWDTSAKVWDVETGELFATLDGHTDSVSSAVFSPDGKRIVIISGGRIAKIWDVETGELLASLDGHRGDVTSVVFSPDGSHIVTSSEDRSAKVWAFDSSISGMMAEAEERLARLLPPKEQAAIFEDIEPCSP